MGKKDGRDVSVSIDKSYWYEHSSLSKWLRYDAWTFELGLPLICNIDMENSGHSDAWDGQVLSNAEATHNFDVNFALIALLSEDPIFQLPPIRKPNNTDLGDYIQRLTTLKKDSGRDEVEIDSGDVLTRMSARHYALMKLQRTYDIFMSNSDHGATEKFKPAYFLNWATLKGINIPWLDWAKNQSLVDLLDTTIPHSSLGTRERNTLLVVIAALCKECNIDPKKRAITKKLVGLTEKIGTPVSDDKIREILKSLESAVESRTKYS